MGRPDGPVRSTNGGTRRTGAEAHPGVTVIGCRDAQSGYTLWYRRFPSPPFWRTN